MSNTIQRTLAVLNLNVATTDQARKAADKAYWDAVRAYQEYYDKHARCKSEIEEDTGHGWDHTSRCQKELGHVGLHQDGGEQWK